MQACVEGELLVLVKGVAMTRREELQWPGGRSRCDQEGGVAVTRREELL